MIPSSGMTHLRSSRSVAETLSALQELLAKRGVPIACHVSHSDAARAAGLAMRPTELLIFGNPKAGTPLMLATPTLALDLPLKALIWEDADGAIWLTYNSVAYLRERHGSVADMHALAAVEPLFHQAAGAAPGI